MLKKNKSNHKTSAKEICKRIKKGRRRFFKDVFNIWGIDVYLAAARNDKGELMILVSNNSSKSTFKHYLKRWSIEVLFKYLKRHGFNLESTHITTNKSLEVLFFILTLAVVWTVKVSSSLEKESPPKVAKHGRKRVSFFRRGLTAIRSSIQNLGFCMDKLIGYCRLLISRAALEIFLRRRKKNKKKKILLRIIYGGDIKIVQY